ncbi:styrene monooxygenase/indole monooxygenase family protein [Streptomyces sp. NPDC091377]|uniref:styrene monooxygenase/indole monooxygenase family protein n=1 Tax=Streptomyces sp. NPDC091377 TaxID=3365995 RepID=UPI00380FF978
MQSIVVIGAGQAGLLVSLGLQRAGYHVRIVSDRSAEEIRSGRVLSGQCLFEPALREERALGLHYWDGEAAQVSDFRFSMGDPESHGRRLHWSARFDRPASSVDQRLKMSRWLDEFVGRGGDLRVGRAGVEDIDRYAAHHDLVLVAAGRGDQFAALFPRDDRFSPYRAPQRTLALIYVACDGNSATAPPRRMTFNVRPGVGEFYWLPITSVHGPVHGLCLSGLPGGPLDCWDGVTDTDRQWEMTVGLIREHFAWDADFFSDARPAGRLDALIGRVTPTVRHAVGTLPSGRPVLAMGDAAITNDPISGQGANNAVHCAVSYLDSIVHHEGGRFDREFMERCYARYWNYARHATRLSNDLLAPPSDQVLATLEAARSTPGVAHRFASMFVDPSDYEVWLADPESVHRYRQSA